MANAHEQDLKAFDKIKVEFEKLDMYLVISVFM